MPTLDFMGSSEVLREGHGLEQMERLLFLVLKDTQFNKLTLAHTPLAHTSVWLQ